MWKLNLDKILDFPTVWRSGGKQTFLQVCEVLTKKFLHVNNWYLCGFDNVLILVLFCANPLEVNDHWFFFVFSLSMKRWEFATIHWWELAVMMLKVLKFATLTMKLLAKPLTKPTKLNKTSLSVEWKSWPNAKMSNVSLI